MPIKLYEDNEMNVLDMLHDQYVCILFPENEHTISLANKLRNPHKQKRWMDNSANTENPPDIISPKNKMMIDVMQVDEYVQTEIRGKKVKHINPAKASEHKKLQQLYQALPNDTQLHHVIVCDSTPFPHGYQQYCDEFKRVVEYHNSRVPAYRQNFPGYKTIFLILDLSALYLVNPNQTPVKEGEVCQGMLHYWFVDDTFIKVLQSVQCEYVVWFTPYKQPNAYCMRNVKTGEAPQLPQICIYDIQAIQTVSTIKYDAGQLHSVEV
ncbi:MAG: hypothetical protein IJZ68_05475 [Bacteroidaceae bacterium]|nr:hypothetical protein [Bacteroidaceae bacterium]